MDEPVYLSGTNRPAPFVPQRAISLVPWVSESLAELALADRLIAVTDDAAFPEGGFPWAERIGPSWSPDVARMRDLQPDLVLLGPEQPEARFAAQAAGIPVWLAAPQSVRESFNVLWDWMNAFERPQMTARVRAIEWTCDWLERLAETRPAPARVLALAAVNPWTAVAGPSYAHDLVRVCGGDALFGAAGAETLTLELRDIGALQPDVLLIADDVSHNDEAALKALDVPAARNGRIVRVDMTLLAWPGTRVARAFDTLPVLLDIGR